MNAKHRMIRLAVGLAPAMAATLLGACVSTAEKVALLRSVEVPSPTVTDEIPLAGGGVLRLERENQAYTAWISAVGSIRTSEELGVGVLQTAISATVPVAGQAVMNYHNQQANIELGKVRATTDGRMWETIGGIAGQIQGTHIEGSYNTALDNVGNDQSTHQNNMNNATAEPYGYPVPAWPPEYLVTPSWMPEYMFNGTYPAGTP